MAKLIQEKADRFDYMEFLNFTTELYTHTPKSKGKQQTGKHIPNSCDKYLISSMPEGS